MCEQSLLSSYCSRRVSRPPTYSKPCERCHFAIIKTYKKKQLSGFNENQTGHTPTVHGQYVLTRKLFWLRVVYTVINRSKLQSVNTLLRTTCTNATVPTFSTRRRVVTWKLEKQGTVVRIEIETAKKRAIFVACRVTVSYEKAR